MKRSQTSVQTYRIREDVAFREVDGAYHFLTSDHRYHCVEDQVGAFVLAQVCSRRGATLDALVKAVLSRFEAPEPEVRRDLRAFLTALQKRKVLTASRARQAAKGRGMEA